MKAEFYALALALCLSGTQSQAACTQGSLTGKWGVYVQSNGNTETAIACDVAIGPTGTITAGNSGCASTSGASSTVSGSIKLKNGSLCDYGGTVTLNAFRLKETFLRSTLSPDRGTLTGIGYEPSSRIGYIFTMVKLP